MEAGADAMVTPCPLCHLSLDAWQSKLKKQTGRDFKMPILHLSQLVGVAAGLTDSELKFKRHVVSVDPVVEKLSVSRSALRRRAQLTPDTGEQAAWLARSVALARARAGAARLRAVRGRVAAHAGARGRDRGPAGGARRAPDRAPLGLPPRRSVARDAWRPSAPSRGWRSGGPTSSASPATSSRTRAACRCSCELLGTLDRPLVVLGNHDVADHARPVLARGRARRARARSSTLLRDEATVVEQRGCRVQVVGADAATYPRGERAAVGARRPRTPTSGSCSATSPAIARRLPAGAFDLVLTGPPARRADRAPVPGRQGAARAPRLALRGGALPGRGRRHARLAGHRHDVRAHPLLRAARR